MATPPPPPPIPGKPGSGAPPLPSAIPAPKPVGPGPAQANKQPPSPQPGGAPPPGHDPNAEEFHDPYAVPLTFWQQPWVQNLLPFLTSLTVHAAIILIVVVTAMAVREMKIAMKPENEEQIIIPEAAMAADVPGGVENPGLGGDPTRPAAQDQYEENTDPQGWAPEPGESSIAEAEGGGEADGGTDFTQGAKAGFGTGSGFGTGTGDGTGGGGGSGRGKVAPFGAPGGGIPGPRGKLFGSGGNARTIAFSCDASGSMVDKMSALKLELSKAIAGLKPIQQFSVVFFSEGKPNAFEGGALVPATSENIRKAEKWMADIVPAGQTDPISGLDVSFKTRPDLLYLLTDGEFDDNAAVIKRIGQLNPQKKTRVNTIAFVSNSRDEVSESFTKFLEGIAKDNAGVFNQVALDQLD